MKTPYLALLVILAVGVSGAYAVITITLEGNVVVTGDLAVDGDITGTTVTNLQSQINQGVAEQSCTAGKVLVGFDSQGVAICKTIKLLDGSDELIETGGGKIGSDNSIAIGSDGLPVISYVDTSNNNIKVAKCLDPICSSSTNVILDTAGTTNEQFLESTTTIIVPNDGRPIVSYIEDNGIPNTFLKIARCGNADCSAGNNFITLDSNVAPSGIAMVLDDGLPYLVYSDPSFVLKFIKCGNLECSAGNTKEDVFAAPSVNPLGLSLRISNDGFPVMAFQSSNVLKVLKCDTDDCFSVGNTVSTVDATNGAGLYSSIAIDENGNPIIAYYESSLLNLKFAKCVDSGCIGAAGISTLESTGNVGYETSMILGDDGNPVIVYGNDNSIKIMRCEDSTCNSTESKILVESIALEAALVLGDDGNPVISYRDTFNLRVALDGTIAFLIE